MRGVELSLVATLAVALSGCHSTEPAPLVCEPGVRQECACEVGTGMQDCATDGTSWGQCLCPVTNVVYTPDAHPVDLRADSGLEVSGMTLRISRAGHDDIAALQAGDVLVNYGSPPLLRRILSTSLEGDTIVLETRLAALHEAFDDLTVHLSGTRLNMYGALPESTRAALESSRLGLAGDAGGLSFGAAGNLTAGITMSDTSRVWFDPTVDVDLDVNADGLQTFKFVAGLDAGFDFTTTITLSGMGHVSVYVELIELILSHLEPPILPPEIVIPLGAGLTVSPKIMLGCDLSVDGHVELETNVHAGFTVRGGIDYVKDRPGDDLRFVNENSVEGGAALLDTTYKAGVQLTCYIRPRLELSFLEVVTGYAEIGPNATSRVEFGRNNYFMVTAGVTGTVGYRIGLDAGPIDIILREDSYDLFNLSQILYYNEFAICGDGYRQVPDTGGTAEDCDTGLMSDPACVDCRCADLTIPVDFRPYIAGDENYRWRGQFNRCRASCWNGVVDPGELCDEGFPGTCPGTTTVGCGDNCQRHTGICGDGIVECGEACDDGNTVSCDGCDEHCWWTDNCGNGVTNSACGEQCDDGNSDDTDGCTNTCRRPFCGNGSIEMGEECDDSNDDDCDACHNDCTTNTPACGDGHVCGMEECDFGPPMDRWNCDADCTIRACGDGHRNPLYEQCDDGNTDDCDACHNDCTTNTPTCGDGHTCPPEVCDSGGVDTRTCDADCTAPVCGDGHYNPVVERCDDGDTSDCTAACNSFCWGPAPTPRCGDNLTSCGEACDDGPFNGFCGRCAADCSTTFGVCGDRRVDTICGEVCDDGNTTSGDGCRGDCRGTEVCGDNIVDVGEVCDDGDPRVCEGTCNSTCTAALTGSCGDGTITPPCEVCEDTVPGNTSPDMGCTTAEPNCDLCRRCSADVCGDGIVGPSEACELTRQCFPSETRSCTDVSMCPMGDTDCIPTYLPGDCNRTCTGRIP